MSCKDLKGEELKKCRAREAKAKEAKAKEAKAKEAAKDARIASLEKSVVDLNAANFRNKDVMKWEERKKKERRTSGSGTGLTFGGRTTRLQRKKNNRSQRG